MVVVALLLAEGLGMGKGGVKTVQDKNDPLSESLHNIPYQTLWFGLFCRGLDAFGLDLKLGKPNAN